MNHNGSMFESYLYSGNALIAWRRGTGDNVEITYFRADTPGGGHGTQIFCDMLRELKSNPPYATIYGFTRCSNTAAIEAYTKLGFTLSRVEGVYADREAMVFSARYKDLCLNNGVDTETVYLSGKPVKLELD